LKVLVADDDPIERRLLEKSLTTWGHEVALCEDGVQAWERLQAEASPQLLILDWMMPKMNGIALCKLIREQEEKPYHYIILLTGRSTKGEMVQGLEAGADDYITKPFDPNELKVRVRVGVRIMQLQDDLMSALRLSDIRATHDPLTGLWNRAAILDAIEREMARCEREGTPLGLLMGDVDRFKEVNDRHGHLAGDTVLKEITARILGSLRPYDSAGRYGGEEFIVVLPGCDREKSRSLAERLRISIAERPVGLDVGIVSCTMSFGVASWEAGEKPGVDALLRDADAALYSAKRAGRNRVVLSSSFPEGVENGDSA
jgi:two-component system, cell cycle response regulator